MTTMLSAPEFVESTSKLTEHELASVVGFVCARFPQRSRDEVADVVATAYRHLSARANVTAHLIPLTVNRSLRILRQSTPVLTAKRPSPPVSE